MQILSNGRCIYQDDLDDWSEQAASMQDIYQHAALNIAATAAQDGTFGLFYHRDSLSRTPFRVDVAWQDSKDLQSEKPAIFQPYMWYQSQSVYQAIDKACLNQRAWVMQERQLSRRTAHYSKEMVFWECHESFTNEIRPEGLPASEAGYEVETKTSLKHLLNLHESADPNGKEGGTLFEAWNMFLQGYSLCQSTYKTDKLVALAGLAQRTSALLQDELVAGLWRARFVEQLCWKSFFSLQTCQSCIEPRDWIAPSWSWASADNEVEVRGWESDCNVAELVELTVHTKASGAMTNGFARLKCRLVPSLLRFEKSKRPWEMWSVLSDNGKRLPGISLERVCSEHHTENTLYLAILQERTAATSSSKETRYLQGIALVPSIHGSDAFERVGYFYHHFYNGRPPEPFWRDIVTRFEQAENQIIKII